MSHHFILTEKAQRDLKKLDPRLRHAVEKKLKYFLSADDPMEFAEPLVHLPPATHRFRVGKVRVTFFCQKGVFYLTSIELRDKVYRT